MRVTMKRTIEERDGERPVTYHKGTIWNVSNEQGNRWIADGAAEDAPDAPLGKVGIEKSVSVGSESVSVTAYPVTSGITPPTGETPQIRIVEVSGTVLIGETPTCRDWKPFTSMWSLRRPAKGNAPGRVRIISQCTGFSPDELVIEIPALDEVKHAEEQPTETKARASRRATVAAEE